MDNALAIFHPVIRRWFADRVGRPTDVQATSWPLIAAGEHVLITAPTGSGKTLTAFLWALNQLIVGRWPGGQIRVLYVSPLKALNNDIQRNLLGPLEELRARFDESGEDFPEIRVQTRSGDTEQVERRRMLRHPPEILITTPESLNLLLSSRMAQPLLSGISTVILDEIHYVAGSKRGTHLITAVDRLVWLSGEFQRVAISATIKPVDAVADFVAGYQMRVHDGQTQYVRRPVRIVASGQGKKYAVTVRFPGASGEGRPRQAEFLPRLAEEFKRIIRRNQSTLLFTNNRRLCERLSLLINQDEEETLAYSHHGSLSREMRTVVEQRLKAGALKAIVATSSLELGIDIGALDETILVQTPLSVSSAVQRVGRAGHQVGAVSRGALFPTHGRDLVDAAVMARNIVRQDIESIQPVSCPLDVLAQIIVSMTGIETWDLDALYAFLRTTWPYHALKRDLYDRVIDMLAGRYQAGRLRALQPLVSVDRLDNTVTGKDASLRLLYSSGGTIPDRGYFGLRHATTHARIGELDEEFVWEQSIGDTFALGMQSWRIRDITHNDVFAEPVAPHLTDVPFWRAEDLDRGFHFAGKVAEFLERANPILDDPELIRTLQTECYLDEPAARSLVEFLQRQRNATGADLPHRHHVLVEYTTDPDAREQCTRVVLHTLWGGRVNRPFASVLAQAWEDKHHERLDVYSNNDCVVLVLPGECERVDAFSLVEAEAIESLLRKKLEKTGFFGARFRENAARALLLPRHTFRKRMPLWLNRLRSKRLLDVVSQYDDFPILVETWRACLHDEFDLGNLRRMLEEIRTGETRTTETRTAVPSPFAQGALWRLTNQYMYQDDTPLRGRASKLGDELLKDVVFSAELRPRIAKGLVHEFEQKAQRVFPGYTPRCAEELLDWVKERLFIPEPEWRDLLDAIKRDHHIRQAALLDPVARKLVTVHLPGGATTAVVAVECLPRLLRAMGLGLDALDVAPVVDGEAPLTPPADTAAADVDDETDSLADWLGEWLRFYGPMDKERLWATFPVEERRFEDALESLVESRAIILDCLTESCDRPEVCDSENLEILLRLSRAKARPAFKALPLEDLPLFLAHYQGVARQRDGLDAVHRALEGLFGYPMPARLLETEFLPARLRPYTLSMLEVVMSESDLLWVGCERGKIVLSFSYNRDLFPAPVQPGQEREEMWRRIVPRLFADTRGKYYFSTLLDHTRLSVAELTESLWEFVWEGRITNDSFAALRKGIETKFKAVEPAGPSRLSHRIRRDAWQTSRAYPGNWYALPPIEAAGDAVDEEELNKERVRALLDRYGILFRELLAQELPDLRWAALFRTLRLMELAGEVLTGYFFDGIPGLQFIGHEAFRMLQGPLPRGAVFWVNAADPASLCGIGLPGMKPFLPKRLTGAHLVYEGTNLVLVSKRHGKELDIRVPPEHPRLERYFDFMTNLLTRPFLPIDSISIETINDHPANKSPYLQPLRNLFDLATDTKKATVWRRTGSQCFEYRQTTDEHR